MKIPKVPAMPKAPVSNVVRRAQAYMPAFAAFAHHAPARERENAHMTRPHGGRGPRNFQER